MSRLWILIEVLILSLSLNGLDSNASKNKQLDSLCALYFETYNLHMDPAVFHRKAHVFIEKIPKYLSRHKKKSSFARALNVPYLARSMTLDDLVEAFKNGELRPSSSGGQWNAAVYMGFLTPLRLEQLKTYFPGKDVHVYFDLSLLDRSDFWINPAWDKGTFDDASILGIDPKFKQALYSYVTNKINYGDTEGWGTWERLGPEIVFPESVPTATIRQIFAHQKSKAEVLKFLRNQNLPDIENIEKLVTDAP